MYRGMFNDIVLSPCSNEFFIVTGLELWSRFLLWLKLEAKLFSLFMLMLAMVIVVLLWLVVVMVRIFTYLACIRFLQIIRKVQ